MLWELEDVKFTVGVSATSHKDPMATEAVFLDFLKVKIIDSKITVRGLTRQLSEVPSIREFF